MHPASDLYTPLHSEFCLVETTPIECVLDTLYVTDNRNFVHVRHFTLCCHEKNVPFCLWLPTKGRSVQELYSKPFLCTLLR